MSSASILENTTLVAATSVALLPTLAALRHSMAHLHFAKVKLFTDQQCGPLKAIEVVPIAPLRSRGDYSAFMLQGLVEHISTDHVMVVQWDGYVINGARWDNAFLGYDYIGAPWPQFSDGHDVGNGGFSLRSRRLLKALAQLRMPPMDAEDIAIARTFRSTLESLGIRFADRATAARFSFERSQRTGTELGFHGAFNMPGLMSRAELAILLQQLERELIPPRDLRTMLKKCLRQADLSNALRLARRLLG